MASSIEYKLEKMAYANTSRQMTWQENMSNTSHQREVKDLVAAGLNPVLSSGGQGAQSYTTSVDSAVNAIGNIQASRENAAAMRYAARQSAAATRAAAAAQLEAAKYGADKSYDASVYHSDKAYKAYIDKPAGNVWSLIDKYCMKSGVSDTLLTSRLIKGAKNSLNNLVNNPSKFFKSFGDLAITSKNFVLSSAGKAQCKSVLKKYGVDATASNMKMLVRATVFGDPIAIQMLSRLFSRSNNSSRSASKGMAR